MATWQGERDFGSARQVLSLTFELKALEARIVAFVATSSRFGARSIAILRIVALILSLIVYSMAEAFTSMTARLPNVAYLLTAALGHISEILSKQS